MPEFNPDEDPRPAMAEEAGKYLTEMAIQDMAEAMDKAGIPGEGRVIVVPEHMQHAVNAAEGLAQRKKEQRATTKLALWKIQYSNAEGPGGNSGTINVAGYSLEDAVCKLRLSNSRYEECTINAVNKMGDIDCGLPLDTLLR